MVASPSDRHRDCILANLSQGRFICDFAGDGAGLLAVMSVQSGKK